MHAVADALRIVLSHCEPLPAVPTPLSPAALGQALAEPVCSVVDVPPFDRTVMDGYAVRSADLAGGAAELTVLEEVTAGAVPRFPVGPGQATRVMTGAPIPDGADAVVMIERGRMLDDKRVRLEDDVKPGKHVLGRGAEVRKGEPVLRPGDVLRPQEVGMLAIVGRAEAKLTPRPRVAVIATGDELIDPPALPGPGQIRNSNAPMIAALVARAGGAPHSLGIGRDRADSQAPLIREGLRSADVLVLSGGVSAGTHDLVPGILREEGVVAHLHKVRLKPGKPFLFGTHESAAGRRLVFGLPGNPVSSFVCFELFMRPALRRLAGLPDDAPPMRLPLREALVYKSDRPTYHPARLEGGGVRAVAWGGSSDLRAFLQADALMVLPEGVKRHEAGEMVEVIRLER
jgi:molybdopterin molybdotransferase